MKTSLTAGQLLRARRLSGTGLSAELIAYRCGATVKQVKKAIDYKVVPRRSKKTAPIAKLARVDLDHGPNPRTVAGIGEVPSITVPETVMEERHRRMAVSPRSFTAAWQGDPLPGYSALDKRQGA